MAKSSLSPTLAMANIETRIVHGVVIKKMTLRKYMEFMQNGGKLIPAILERLFPGESTSELIYNFIGLNRDALYSMLANLLASAPEIIFELIASLLNIEQDVLLDSPSIGPNELWDILEAWQEVNDLSAFFARVSTQFLRP